jgi:hypothetical protein
VWHNVTIGKFFLTPLEILNGNFEKANEEKIKIEEFQRKRRSDMKENNIEFIPKYFDIDENGFGWKLKNEFKKDFSNI